MSFISKVERDRARVKQTAEIFTPEWLVDEMLMNLYKQDPTLFSDPDKTFLEPAAGNGNFVVRILYWKVTKFREANPGKVIPMDRILGAIHAIELMQDNVAEMHVRVLTDVSVIMGITVAEAFAQYGEIVRQNIVCGNFLEWDCENWCPDQAKIATNAKLAAKKAKDKARTTQPDVKCSEASTIIMTGF